MPSDRATGRFVTPVPRAFAALLVLILTLASGLGSLVLPAQNRFRAGVDVVSLGVTVVDRDGRLITDLTMDDFAIVEDGQPQSLRYFASGDGPPLHVGLLFDTSGSMLEAIDLSRTAAIKFLNALPDAEDMTLVDFDTEVRISRYSQRDFPRLVERIRGRRPRGLTALYDALGTYLAGAAEVEGRKVLVLYTDGGDTRSALPWRDILTLLRASDVTIYAVGFLDRRSFGSAALERRRLEQIAQVTGGRAFFPRDAADIDEAYADVLAELRAQYSLGYVSTNTDRDGSWRDVDVAVTREDLAGARLRSRTGYFALFSNTVR